MNKQIETFEKPQAYTPNNVCFWEEESQRLRSDKKQGAILSKAKRFLQEGCIEQQSETEWICKPIKDYNHATHRIRSFKEYLVCGCQGFKIKEKAFEKGTSETKPFCSHTVAVKQFCFLEANK